MYFLEIFNSGAGGWLTMIEGEDNMIKTPKKSLFLILICQINE